MHKITFPSVLCLLHARASSHFNWIIKKPKARMVLAGLKLIIQPGERAGVPPCRVFHFEAQWQTEPGVQFVQYE